MHSNAVYGLPVVIIVAGPPATGKTTLSRWLASELMLPLLNRDSIKEILFDTLGSRDRAWSQQLGAASYQLLYYSFQMLLQTGCACIVESNFQHPFDTVHMLRIQQTRLFTPLQIQCRTHPTVLHARFRQRSSSGERHPGHGDDVAAKTLDDVQMQGWSDPLALDGPIIDLDTTDFSAIDYPTLAATIRRMLGSSTQPPR